MYLKHYELPPPASMYFIAKHFYRKADLRRVISSIHKDSNGEYMYEDPELGQERGGKSLNDGLVFTPEDARLYNFRPGGAKRLLKWKWPEKLSVDFKVDPRDIKKTPMEFDFMYTVRRQTAQDALYKRAPLLNSKNLDGPLCCTSTAPLSHLSHATTVPLWYSSTSTSTVRPLGLYCYGASAHQSGVT